MGCTFVFLYVSQLAVEVGCRVTVFGLTFVRNKSAALTSQYLWECCFIVDLFNVFLCCCLCCCSCCIFLFQNSYEYVSVVLFHLIVLCMLKCIVACVFECVVCYRCVDSWCVFDVVVELSCWCCCSLFTATPKQLSWWVLALSYWEWTTGSPF